MIEFENHEIDFQLQQQESVQHWLLLLVREAGQTLAQLNYVFMSDEALLALNREYLDHDYYTDILTFPYHAPGDPILSDIYISVDRVRDNAQELGISFEDELHRVMVHGLLHLLGYDDHSDADRAAMRRAEDQALAQRG